MNGRGRSNEGQDVKHCTAHTIIWDLPTITFDDMIGEKWKHSQIEFVFVKSEQIW